MKKSVLFILFLILLANSISALTINIKENYAPGETLIASIEGNFITPLAPEQIYFYSGRIQIPLIYDLGKIQDKYYIYALLPTDEKNLSLVIKQAHYIEALKEYNQDITKNFSVSGNIVPFSVSPGFIITNKDFEIKIQSIGKAITASSDFLDSKQEVYVPESQQGKIKFSISDIENFTITEIKISADSVSYLIPAAIISNITEEEKKNISISKKLRFSPDSGEFASLVNSEREINLTLMNLGEDLKDIEIKIPESLNFIKINPNKFDLSGEQSKELSLKIKPTQTGLFYDSIEAKAENISAYFDLNLTVVSNITDITTNWTLESCLYNGGSICAATQECSGQIKNSTDGDCCIGGCKEKPSQTNYFWFIIIILVLAGIAFFLYKKYKKPGKSASEILKAKQTSAETRLSGEVRGKLDRV